LVVALKPLSCSVTTTFHHYYSSLDLYEANWGLMGTESEINATTKYVQTNFIYIRIMGQLAVVHLTTSFVHMPTNDDHKAL